MIWPRTAASLTFALALLSKFIAVCVLPAMVLFEWVGAFGPTGRTRRLRWLGCDIQAGISYHHYGHMDVILPAPI